MATRQLLRFGVMPAMVDRTDGVDHIFGGKAATCRYNGFPGGEVPNLAHNFLALIENRGAGRAMNRAIDSATAQKR